MPSCIPLSQPNSCERAAEGDGARRASQKSPKPNQHTKRRQRQQPHSQRAIATSNGYGNSNQHHRAGTYTQKLPPTRRRRAPFIARTILETHTHSHTHAPSASTAAAAAAATRAMPVRKCLLISFPLRHSPVPSRPPSPPRARDSERERRTTSQEGHPFSPPPPPKQERKSLPWPKCPRAGAGGGAGGGAVRRPPREKT
jgi:hypothetical protein